MNTKRLIMLPALILATQPHTGYAMLTGLRLATLRPTASFANTLLVPPLEVQSGFTLFAQRPTLLARVLSTHRHEHTGDNKHQSSNENDSQGEYNNWWQFFRSSFRRKEATPMLGLSIFGCNLWWSDSDVCQTPEDFRNPEKLNRTKECFAAGQKNRVFDVFLRNFDGIKHDPKAFNKVLEFLCTTFDDFKTDTSRMALLLDKIATEYPVIEKNKWGKKLLTKIAKEPSILQDALTINKLFAKSSTQSAQHFKALINPNFTKMTEISKFTSGRLPKCLSNIVETVLTIEKEEQDKGNYTFVHTYHWHVHFFQDIDAHLRRIAYGGDKQPLSLRFIKKPNHKKQKNSESQRKDLLLKNNNGYYHNAGLQKKMIFMNYALFAGCNNNFVRSPYLSNALYFFLKNHSEQKPTLYLEKIAKHLNMQVYFKRYEKEFAELQVLHDCASTYGAGIVFSFTPEMLRKSVFVANPGGSKRTVYIKHYGWTDDVKLILDTLRSTEPERIMYLDMLEFVFVVTKDCALNPHVQKAEGYKIIPFNAADPEKLALYEQKRDELMAKIAADIKAERAAWNKQKKLAHEKALKQMNELFANYSCLNGCKKSRVQEA